MTANTAATAKNDRPDIDPNIPQRAAADPEASVWVGASAGSGKTKVLTDRVLRLLLPRADGNPGTPPEKILCLTYTKAGASEMAIRISDTLSLWATMPLEAENKKPGLLQVLSRLTGQDNPPQSMIDAARRLFARVVDTPGGLKIMTIHAFCQSVLGRFPLEAGLPPHFTVLTDDQARSLLLQARDDVLKQAGYHGQRDTGDSLARLAAALAEDDFAALMQKLCSERQTLRDLFKARGGPAAIRQDMGSRFEIDEDETPLSVARAASTDDVCDAPLLRQMLTALNNSGKKDQKLALAMANWLEQDVEGRARSIDTYTDAFITEDKDSGLMRAKKDIGAKDAEKQMSGIKDLLIREAERLLTVRERIALIGNVQATHDLLHVGEAIISRYQDLKLAQAGLDFDDMINCTRDLLRRDGLATWVLYKLDGGLDHILVDEAQDTNPEQWDIVESLIGEFFTGEASDNDPRRTLFVVGDEKQSIYSFQRAAPDRFHQKRTQFKNMVENAGQTWKDIPLDVSFRSTSAVLSFTDNVFMPEDSRAGVSRDVIHHASFRKGHAGHIEQWPIFRALDDDSDEPDSKWVPVLTPRTQNNARALLARHIAETITGWIGKEELPSRGRMIEAGDIMILMRNRSALVGHIIRELKSRNIPVNGLDRMKLGEHIAVEDMMAVARFALLPEDDLSLACILKSPLMNWNDQQLENVAAPRKGSLWEAVRIHAKTEDVAWLRAQVSHARHMRPYEFFSQILQTPCPASTISGQYAMTARLGEDAIDPLDEFLSMVLSFEGDHVSSVQNFVLWQQQSETVIKREQDDAGGRVRIMTVHASKGLQAPIVILPDTLKQKGSGNHAANRLLWPNKTSLPFPFWSPYSEADSTAYRECRDRARDKDQEEYRRLLYVALTRAEDRLYIGAAGGGKPHDPGSWYELTRAAFGNDAIRKPFHASDDVMKALDPGPDPEQFVSCLISTPQEIAPKTEQKDETGPVLALPDLSAPAWSWVYDAPQAEPLPPRPLIPSQATQATAQEPAALSPLLADNGYRFRRGNLTHRLLQFLPDLDVQIRTQAAGEFVERYGHDLPADVRAGVVTETMRILEHPEYADLFGPASRAEVPITGLINGKLVSGQIDRLLVTDTHVHIVDYKTNRPPPQDAGDVPALYRQQLAAYRDTLAAIYPHRTIKTWLLWTDGPDLMAIEP